MAQLILTRNGRANSHRTLRSSGSYPVTLRLGTYFMLFTLTLLIGVISFFYLLKSTEIHTKGYQLGRLDQKRDKLVRSKESQNTDIAYAKSLSAIRDSGVTNKMVPMRNPTFVRGDGNIAQVP